MAPGISLGLDIWTPAILGWADSIAPGALASLDFANSQYFPSSLASLTTFSRTSDGWTDSLSFNWSDFLSGVARITNKGLRYEPARTNSIRNPKLIGAQATDGVQLLTNTNFPSNLTGWNVVNAGASTTVWTAPNQVTLTADGTNQTYLEQSFPTVIGSSYTFRTDFLSDTNVTRVYIGTTQGGSNLIGGQVAIAGAAGNTSGTTFQFIATTTTTWIRIRKPAIGTAVLTSTSCMLGSIPQDGGWNIEDLDLTMFLTCVGTGTDSGLPYFDLRVNGTPIQSHVALGTDAYSTANGAAPATQGQTWAASAFYKLVAGTLANVTSLNNEVYQSLSTGGETGTAVETAFTPTSTLTRFSSIGTLNGASTVNVTMGITPRFTVGQPVDFTLRIAAPQLENCNGASPGFTTAPILPTGSGTTSATTRAADLLTMAQTGIGRAVFTLDDGSQQTISGISTGSQYAFPTTLNKRVIRRADLYAS